MRQPESSISNSVSLFITRSWSCQKPFEGVESNLKKLFERNEKLLKKFTNGTLGDSSELAILSPRAETERCVAFFMEMISSVLFRQTSERSMSKVACSIP